MSPYRNPGSAPLDAEPDPFPCCPMCGELVFSCPWVYTPERFLAFRYCQRFPVVGFALPLLRARDVLRAYLP